MNKFFESKEASESQKRDIAFQTVVATRDMLNTALNNSTPVTYEQTFSVIHDLDPELYKEFNRLLSTQNENDELKLFKEIAAFESREKGSRVSVEELLDKEIKRFEDMLNAGVNVSDDLSDEDIKANVRFIKKKIASLVSARQSLTPRRLTENRIIMRDYSKIDRSYYFAERIYETDEFVDYKLPDNRYLRIRFLHPDEAEHITGADLIYEQIDPKRNRIRFLFLQYKTWDEKGVIYFSENKSILAQIGKMRDLICGGGFCTCSKAKPQDDMFRFPFCSAFWRPTDKLQNSDSKMISTGYHIPVCEVQRISEKENKIEKRHVRKSSVSHNIFEELFNQNLIGSDWIPFAECEEFYKKSLIMKPHDRIRIVAREFIEV